MLQRLFGQHRDKEISAHETFEGAAADGLTVVDVREPDEWQSGHIAQAIHIPLGELEQRAGEIPTDKPVVTVCKAGGRSLAAVSVLNSAGLGDVRSMAGGMTDWRRRGYPVA